jgi:hypothetical protein
MDNALILLAETGFGATNIRKGRVTNALRS